MLTTDLLSHQTINLLFRNFLAHNLTHTNMLAASKCTILKQFFITCNILIVYTYITKFSISINFQRFNIWFMHFYRTIKVINKRNISGSIFIKDITVNWNT